MTNQGDSLLFLQLAKVSNNLSKRNQTKRAVFLTREVRPVFLCVMPTVEEQIASYGSPPRPKRHSVVNGRAVYKDIAIFGEHVNDDGEPYGEQELRP